MDIEITPDQPKFCPNCHGEMSPLTVGVMARHDLHLPARPVDPVKEWEHAIWGMVLPSALAVMFAAAGYCPESHSLEGGPIGVKLAILLSGGATLLLGLVVKKSVIRKKRSGAKYLDYESALEKWRIEMESFQRQRICVACQLIMDGRESISLGRLQERVGDRAVPEQMSTQPQRCVRTH